MSTLFIEITKNITCTCSTLARKKVRSSIQNNLFSFIFPSKRVTRCGNKQCIYGHVRFLKLPDWLLNYYWIVLREVRLVFVFNDKHKRLVYNSALTTYEYRGINYHLDYIVSLWFICHFYGNPLVLDKHNVKPPPTKHLFNNCFKKTIKMV